MSAFSPTWISKLWLRCKSACGELRESLLPYSATENRYGELESLESVPFRCATANIRQEIEWGEDRIVRRGNKQFRGGAKVYLIDRYSRSQDAVVAIGRHRKSNRFIKIIVRSRHLENFRVTEVYKPRVLEIAQLYFSDCYEEQPEKFPYSPEELRDMAGSWSEWELKRRASKKQTD